MDKEILFQKTGNVLIQLAPSTYSLFMCLLPQDVVKTPHYLVLVDSRFDASGVPYRYLPQEDLEPVPAGTQVRALELDYYFEGYSNNHHVARPWLRNVYPRD